MPLPVPLSAAQLEELAAVYGTPLQLYSEPAIRANARALVDTFAKRFPRFRQFYAVKALPNPAILEVLIQEGCGLDCSSTAELHIAQLLGVPGDRIMYTSNYTSPSDLGVAFDQGVIMNLDDISLVDSVVAVRGRVPDLISFRLNPGLGRTDSETASNVLGGPDAKFGVPPDQIVEGYRRAKAAGATRFGMHMMTGSCVLNNDYWAETVTVLLETVARVSKELGITFEFINIGGGLGIPYRPRNLDTGAHAPADVEGVAVIVRRVMDEQVKKHGLPAEPALYMENGRYMTGPFGWLVSRCEVVKRAFDQTYFGLDACMANLMRPGMYEAYHHITVPARETFDGTASTGTGASAGAASTAAADSSAKRAPAHVVGTLCENNDWFARSRDLPADAAVGDLFVIHDTGAHSHSMGFQYNGKLRAPEVLIRSTGGATAPVLIGGAAACADASTLAIRSKSLTTAVIEAAPGAAASGTGASPLHYTLYPPPTGPAALPDSAVGAATTVSLIRDRETLHCLFDNTHMPVDLASAGGCSARGPHVFARFGDGDMTPFPYAGRGPAPAAAATLATSTPKAALGLAVATSPSPAGAAAAAACCASSSHGSRVAVAVVGVAAVAAGVVALATTPRGAELRRSLASAFAKLF